jgi:hypothetical protein
MNEDGALQSAWTLDYPAVAASEEGYQAWGIPYDDAQPRS